MKSLPCIVCTLFLVVSCGPEGTLQPVSRGDCICPESSEDGVHYGVIYPNGGEVFRIGDTVRIHLCSDDSGYYTLDDANKSLSIDNGRHWSDIVYEQGDGSCDFIWVVPPAFDYFDFGTGELKSVSTVSDSCLLQVSIYSSHPEYTDKDHDESNGVFRIIAR